MSSSSAGRHAPRMLYGTAWKEDATESLVLAALDAGFRGFDTANQRKHYFEQGVGRALATRIRDGQVTRDELFIQTKFTFVDGQDHRLPYDPHAPVSDQVRQSLTSSLDHLAIETIDCLVLHGPSRRDGLAPADREAWQTMEALAGAGQVGALGVSNVTAAQLAGFIELARVPIAFVQNRCYAHLDWDASVRELCTRHRIVYQGFSLLTANRHVLAARAVQAIAVRHARTPAQIVFRFAQQLGMLPLTGTRDPEHMRQDLAAADLALTDDEIAAVRAAGQGRINE